MNGLNISPKKTKENACRWNWMEWIACQLLLTGLIGTMCSGFPSIAGIWGGFAAGSLLIGFLFAGLFQTKYRKWIVPVGLLFSLAVTISSLSTVINGIGLLGNDVLDLLTGKQGNIYLSYPVRGEQGVWMAAALPLFWLLLAIHGLSGKNRRIFCWLLMMAAFGGCAYGVFRADAGLVIMTVGMLFLSAGKYYESISMKNLLYTNIPMLLLTMVFLIPAIFSGKIFANSLSFETEVCKLKSRLHKISYDTGADGMPEGNLLNIGAFEKSHETALRLNMQTPQKLYLRGRIGEIYTGISWEGMDEEVYREGEALFYWLHKEGFYGQTMIADAWNKNPAGEKSQKLKIINEGACKEHFYLPYALNDQTVLLKDAVGDNRTSADRELMEVDYFPGSVPQWYQLAIWLSENQKTPEVTDYLKKEESYREFVYANDLQLTNTIVGAFENIFTQDQDTRRSLSDILDLVREILDNELTYDETAVTYNGKNDFAKYTLEQSRRGYSPHYATLATLMLRYMGVPARYVEGYFLSADEAEKYNANEEIVLTEAHAHAWTEYYMDGVGWIPFEITPGYIDEEEWEETRMILADGMGEGTGKGFSQSSLTYTPPKIQEQDTDLPNLRSVFRFEVKQVLFGLLLFVLLVLIFVFYRILKRFLRLKGFRKQMKEAENRICIIELYGYAMMLNERFHILDPTEYADEKKINEAARFGTGIMEDSQRKCIEVFVKQIIKGCETQCSFWKKIKYRYILWLF